MNKYYIPARQNIKQRYCKKCGRPLFPGEDNPDYCEECGIIVTQEVQQRIKYMTEQLKQADDEVSGDAFDEVVNEILKRLENEKNSSK